MRLLAGLGLVVLVPLLGDCSADSTASDAPSPQFGRDSGGGAADSGADSVTLDVGLEAAPVEAGGSNSLCGSLALCNPDDPRSCSSGSSTGGAPGQGGSGGVPASPGGAGGTTSTSGSGGVSPVPGGSGGLAGLGPTTGGVGMGGTAGTGFIDAGNTTITAGNGGTSSAPVDGGSSGEGGPNNPDAGADASGMPASPTQTIAGCQVVEDKGARSARCGLSGVGVAGDRCQANRDCAPGLGCVESKDGQGQCFPYCCSGPEYCTSGSYCTQRLAVNSDPFANIFEVPVCIPADDCSLSEPYPCPPEMTQECTCSEGTVCTVVRSDGTTSCEKPGVGQLGDPCPCDAGYLCSEASSTCLKLCSTALSSDDCGPGTCQAVSVLPGYGVCVGLADGG